MRAERVGAMKKKASWRRVKVDVGQSAITTAIRADSGHCMIADAIRAMYPEVNKVSVDLQSVRLTAPDGNRYMYFTPPIAQDALVRFDQGETFDPFSFTLRVAQVVPVNADARKKRSERLAELEAKEAAGTLTDREQRSLVQLRKPGTTQRPPRGRAIARDPDGHVSVIGGKLPPTAALSSTKGRRRAFGLRLLKRPTDITLDGLVEKPADT